MKKRKPIEPRNALPPMKRWGYQWAEKFLIVYATKRMLAAMRLASHTEDSVYSTELVDLGPSTFSPKASGRDAA
jgi:hypothetical protein